MLGLGLLEVGLRRIWGFGHPPLYVADSDTGYRLVPNQSLRRFGNRIAINQYSMRGGAIVLPRPKATWRILLLGDSVANGGWWTDQESILSQQLENHLGPMLASPYRQVEVLNASANSWGPRNEWGYVKQFGLFDAQMVVVLLNTDDLFGIAPTSVQVGRDRNYPDQRPPFALVELLSKLQPPSPLPEYEALLQESGDRVGHNLEALRQIALQAQQTQTQLLLAMTPLLRETQIPGPRDYELKARDRLQQFALTEGIPYLDFLPLFTADPDPEVLFRDHIHLSPTGYALVNRELAALVQSHLQS